MIRDLALSCLIAATITSFNFLLVQGSCTHFYEYIPVDHSPPCDPTGRNVVLYCNGYSPQSSLIDLIWMWAPDLNTPYSEASFFYHLNWAPMGESSVPTSGPFAGYKHLQATLTLSGTGLISELMGYYACTFVHRSAITTPVFEFTPAILLNTTPGVTTPCPEFSTFSFAEQSSPVICAESVVTTTPVPIPTTQETTTESLTTTSDGNVCCGSATYIGVATALFTSICICVVGSIAFVIAQVIHSVEKRKQRKLNVDRNVFDPRNSEEHQLTIHGCKACARSRENN